MKPMKFEASYCSRCTHYTPEGRRGGHCGQLGVPVQGKWKACSLAVPVFLTPVSELQVLKLLPKPIEIHLPESSHFPEARLEAIEASALRYAPIPKK